jgi:hypothetical protein
MLLFCLRLCLAVLQATRRGEYTAVSSAFKYVADTFDLEPGLLPASPRREAAATSVCGGAVLTQVERRMADGITSGFR